MHRLVVFCLAFITLSIVFAESPTAEPDPIPGQLVRIRVYNQTGTPGDRLAPALAWAARVLAAAGLRPEWMECSSYAAESPSAQTLAACAQPLRRGELIVRFARSPESVGRAAKRLPLGSAVVDTHAKEGAIATVYPERVHTLAAKVGTAMAPLMGRVIAHEIVHLVLGTTAHDVTGLMRENWTDAEIRANRPRDWLLTARQAERVRRNLAAMRAE